VTTEGRLRQSLSAVASVLEAEIRDRDLLIECPGPAGETIQDEEMKLVGTRLKVRQIPELERLALGRIDLGGLFYFGSAMP
jgi:hypothetical protein